MAGMETNTPASLGPPDFVAEADCPWGRVRVTLWASVALTEAARAQLLAHLGTVHTDIARRKLPAPQGLDLLRSAVAGPHARAVAAELVSVRARKAIT